MKFNSFSPVPEDNEELHLPDLVYWSSLGELEQVKICIDQGVDVNSTDEDGYSALQAAAENGYLEVVKFLVLKGADVHYKGEYTALELAKLSKNLDIIEYLEQF